MTKQRTVPYLWIILLALCSPICSVLADEPTNPVNPTGQQDAALATRAINHYRIGNYEEAETLLHKALQQEPDNALYHYYLGRTYQGMLKYPQAAQELRRSIALDPKQGNSYAHLAEVLYRMQRYREAEQQLDQAEKRGARIAYVEYLKGLTALELRQFDTAITSLNNAMQANPAYTQKATYALGMAYKAQHNKAAAKKQFEAAMQMNPESPAGVFASIGLQSLQEVKRKPYHFTFNYGFLYDNNVLLQPDSGIYPGLFPKGNKDFKHVFVLEGSYDVDTNSRYDLRLAANYYKSTHHKISAMDMDGFGLSLTPSIPSSLGTFSLEMRGDYYLVHRIRYLRMAGLHPRLTFALGNLNQGSIHAGYQKKDFLVAPPIPSENRDAINTSIGYTHYIHADDLKQYLAIDFTLDEDFATGSNWDYIGGKLDLQGMYPINEDYRLRFEGSIYRQVYRHIHTTYNKKRRDTIFTVSPTLSYETQWGGELRLQYTYNQDLSTTPIYAYRRQIIGVGFEYGF